MGLLKEFKEFAVKGNMVDMAVGIIVGAAFNSVVDALVKQVIMPPLSLLTGDIHFPDKKIILREAVGDPGAANYVQEIAVGYGILLQNLINFIIVGFVLFLFIRFMNRFRAKSQDPKNVKVTTPKDIELLSNLRDLMEEQNKILKERQN
ncbi:large conductance mechanosensitive channel protein MscL [Christiangramia fulva]|uniref:Large-conductance mechanosensitive channel n=1 Tax=Christiangramia fulva TaxID=2126553 RepID=A0A2R3Z7R2_9FLAO|nr:large-conductance mechanosensitive channel protein MscL [Christiangramia fulva]AVR46268.1 large conductance mechanosensitive channel protein MscL [Christiangramia fulva]